jgi:inosine triphosphate pyrophosphatase
MKEIIFVTSNEHKFKEAQNILSDFDIIKKNLDILEIQGDIETIIEYKTKEAYKKVKKPCFCEDTSLCFDAWGGLPGPYIKDFLIKLSPEGLHQALLNFENKKAKAICSIGYMDKNLKCPIIFQGTISGIITEKKGASGFEWDKIFIPDGYEKTFAELGMEIKNKISHRKTALMKLGEYLNKK